MSDLVDTVMDAMEGVEVWVGWGDGVADDDGSYGTLDRDSRRDLAKRVMAALLADPAAMLDALVSAGVLHDEPVSRSRMEECGDPNCSSEPLNRVRTGDHGHCHTVPVTLRRYVTEWEVLRDPR